MPIQLDLAVPKSLSAAVEERIRDAIVNAELAFGQALPEDGVGLAMGVSRTPMREALTRLQAQGLVVIVPKKGTFVFDPSPDDVDQLAGFRLMLESEAVRLSLAGAPAAALAGLRTAHAAMLEARRSGDARAYARADTAFHASFFKECGNGYLAKAYESIAWQVAALRAQLSVPRSHEQETSFSEHAAMIGHFEAGEADGLLEILARHILRSATVYREAIRALSK
ncbi:GntR family transcriptional regulator [Methylobacterium sp. SyP6R]|uniref:GntR family transcriptional regulator n=1 Tax=Methylobacterium sp. SyP6R TaxID=2718876 RepID=UPI001F35015E|nr:GntR family transcriptional regulator [Methylobacterium sp. SyP6R]MCF4124444.1 GntR family transcriptional regulator [Methylobacterium sp. SyP6R]